MNKRTLIGSFYTTVCKPIFFKFDPEFVHDRITFQGKLLGKLPITRYLTKLVFNYDHPALVQEVAGLKFRNPVGLSAGFDKNAQLINILPSVGFGFMEIGSISLQPYEGNPKPRLVRLPKSKALVVYYGLKNEGVKKLVPRFKNAIKSNSIVGVSIAKTNCIETSTMNGGIEDYFECLKYLEETATGDYYTLNISCPNTFGGEPFTTKASLDNLLKKVSELNIKKPLFIKMPINLPINEFDELLQVCIKYKVTGVIIGNLTKVRDESIKDDLPESVKGGISGKPTEKLCNKLISYTYKNYKEKLVIVGVGGIFSAEDAYTKIKLGANLLQLITGMIFQGPQLIGEINQGLVKLLERDGYNNISEAVGKQM